MIESIVGTPYEEAEAVLIGVPYEHSASFGRGAENGPAAVIEVLDEHLEFFDRYTHTSPASEHKFGKVLLDNLREHAPEHMVRDLADFLEKENRFFVLIGGVHSVSIGAFTALARKHNPKNITLVQIDAHFDMRDDDSDYNEVNPSKFAHSTVMRRGHELGFNVLPVGIRTMGADEYSYVTEHNIHYFEWGRPDIATPTVQAVIDSIPTERVYLTIDVDGFDPSVMPGTGTPVPGGLTWEYGEALVREIMKCKDVISADIMEVAPIPNFVTTEYNVAHLAYNILSLSNVGSR
jgi:agmatinase